MTFEELLQLLQDDNPSLTAAELQADLDWLVAHGYIRRVLEAWDEEVY